MSVTTGRRATAPRSTPDADDPAEPNGAATERARTRPRRRAGLRFKTFDLVLVVALAVTTTLVHPIGDMVGHPYWLDEAWVAVLRRAPWSDLARMSSSTPLGFLALIRLVPDDGGQRARLVVLAFIVLTVVAAYVLVRGLDWTRRSHARVAATVVAVVVMLAPISLIRFNLKQYPCDAFLACVLLGAGARAERLGTRGSLLVFGVIAVASVPFSSTSLFVSAAVVAGLFASACIARNLRRAATVAIAGVLTGAALLTYYELVIAPNVNSHLRNFWEGQYLSGAPWTMLHVSWDRLAALDPMLAMPAPVFIALFVAGLVVLVHLGARTLAVALPFLWIEMAAMGRTDHYPFLDQRTSEFLLIPSMIVVALGALGVVGWLAEHRHRGRPVVASVSAAVVALTFAVSFFVGSRDYVRILRVPIEDVRSEALSVAQHRRLGDVILVGSTANFGFAYYWPHGHLRFLDDATSGQGFRVEVRGINAIYARGRDFPSVLASMETAVARLRRAPPGSRLYIVRTHMNNGDYAIWRHAFRVLHVDPREFVVGADSLYILEQSAVERA